MIELKAIDCICVLPNPQWGDVQHLDASVLIKRSMNGVRYTYVQRKEQRQTFIYNMVVLRLKALEFLDFVRTYGGEEIIVVDHKGREIKGYITTNPNTLTMTNRSIAAGSVEQVSFNFEVQGIVQ